MSTEAVGVSRLKRAFTEFDRTKLRNILLVITLLMIMLFLYLYLIGRNPVGVITNKLPIAGPPSYLFSIYGTDENPLKKPMGVVEIDKKVFVADTDNHRIQVFDLDGNPSQIIGKSGTGKGEFQFPYGLATDTNHQLYVADIVSNKVSVLTADGQFLKYFGSTDIKKPAGIAIYHNQVYITDIALNKVLVFDLNGKKLREIGKSGTKPGELRSPNAVTVYKDTVYVSDTGNDRVQMFNILGQYVDILDGAKVPGGSSNLLAPRGVAVDGRGTVFVVNNLLNNIKGYDHNNKPLFTVGTMGNDEEQFYLPVGIFINDQGRIYITDTVNQRVDVYQN